MPPTTIRHDDKHHVFSYYRTLWEGTIIREVVGRCGYCGAGASFDSHREAWDWLERHVWHIHGDNNLWRN